MASAEAESTATKRRFLSGVLARRVISLPTRHDRLESFRDAWLRVGLLEHMEAGPTFEVSEGVAHPVPHVGCGLAHVRAALSGLEEAPCALVLEDDARLTEGLTWNWDLCPVLEAACAPETAALFDVAVLAVAVDATRCLPAVIEHVHPFFVRASPSAALHQGTALLWTRTARPFLLAYEKRVEAGALLGASLPIDRIFHSLTWNAWGPFVRAPPPSSAPPAIAPPASVPSSASDGGRECSPGAVWDAEADILGPIESISPEEQPRVWISKRNLFYQCPDILSDTTGARNVDTRAVDARGLRALVRKADALARASSQHETDR
jgi:hypothetical protein